MSQSPRPDEGNEEGDIGNSVALWTGHSDGVSKLEYIRSKARAGYCYMHALVFICDLARLPLMEFRVKVDEFERSLGFEPFGKDVIMGMVVIVGAMRPDKVAGVGLDLGVVELYRYLENSAVKVPVDERDGKLHLGPACWCGCSGPLCTHGWGFKMLSTVMVMKEKKVGASGFNIEDFMAGGITVGDGEAEQFEDAYSSLEVPKEEIEKSKRRVDSWKKSPFEGCGVVDPAEIREKSLEYVRRMDQRNGTNMAKNLTQIQNQIPRTSAPPPPPMPKANKNRTHREGVQKGQRLPVVIEEIASEDKGNSAVLDGIMDILGKMQIENKGLASKVEDLSSELTVRAAQHQPTPPQSPPMEFVGMDRDSEVSLNPGDSSSVLERYGKQYIQHGTQFSVMRAQSAAEAADNRTLLTANTFLVEGFHRSSESAVREARSVQKLTPINGLPRPFQSNRLNFLANFHTGLGRAITRMQEGTMVEIMIRVIKGNSLVPVDDLLTQVMCVTIDRRQSEYVSNPFNLPYIEIGMLVTEESLVKMLDLIQIEYKQLWFQELKSIVIPRFHSDYKAYSSDPALMTTSRRSRDDYHKVPARRDKGSKSRSILGL